MGRVALELSKMRTPEKLEAAARVMTQIKSMSSSASTTSAASTAQVFQEPFFKLLKGEGTLGKMGWFQNYHKTHFIGGTGRPIVHVCLLIGTIGYTLEYVFHLQYLRHGVRDQHAHAHDSHAAPAEAHH